MHSITIMLQSLDVVYGGANKAITPMVLTYNLKIDQTAAVLLGIYMQVASEYLKIHESQCTICTPEKKCISFREHLEAVETLGIMHERYTNEYLMDNLFQKE